jgi:hypothetical protein
MAGGRGGWKFAKRWNKIVTVPTLDSWCEFFSQVLTRSSFCDFEQLSSFLIEHAKYTHTLESGLLVVTLSIALVNCLQGLWLICFEVLHKLFAASIINFEFYLHFFLHNRRCLTATVGLLLFSLYPTYCRRSAVIVPLSNNNSDSTMYMATQPMKGPTESDKFKVIARC